MLPLARLNMMNISWFLFINSCSGPLAGIINLTKAMGGPKYDGKYLHKLIKGILGGTRLHDTLTAVVIPTFDIKKLQPVIFSSYEVHLLYLDSILLLFLFVPFGCDFIRDFYTLIVVCKNLLPYQITDN